jgi:putative tricarboxylic transport membrane protein
MAFRLDDSLPDADKIGAQLMIDVSSLQSAVDLLFSTYAHWVVIFPGLAIGLVFGAIPGLQISTAMAVFLPMTLYMDFVSAMMFLTSIFTGGGFGGSVSAILMNIPGTSSCVATTFDGYPMAKRGQHNEALGHALSASCIGCGLGYLILFLLIQPISKAVLKLGPTEMFIVVVWGLTLIATLSGKYLARGILSGVYGVLIATIGMGATSALRGTMGSPYLLDGVPWVPGLIGLFAASELFNLMEKPYLVESEEARRLSFRSILVGFRNTFRYPLIILRGSLLGIFIGAVPGIGSSVANLVSYAETRRRAKDADTFGKGNPKGVIAAESANSSSEGGSMATLLALGLPGGGGTAIMLAAFLMHNITGGPRFIREQTDIVYAIIIGNFLQVVALAVIGLFFIHFLSTIVKVPLRYLLPSVLVLTTLGAYGLEGSIVGPITVFIFGVFGWLLRRYEYPVAAMAIGLILGKMAEGELLRSYQISGGQISYLLGRPITLILLLLLIVSLSSGSITQFIRKRRTAS